MLIKFVVVFSFRGKKVMHVIAHNQPLCCALSILNTRVSCYVFLSVMNNGDFSFFFFLGEEVINIM